MLEISILRLVSRAVRAPEDKSSGVSCPVLWSVSPGPSLSLNLAQQGREGSLSDRAELLGEIMDIFSSLAFT